MAMYDAIVVGARCAGAPTAMLLARRGLKVLLVDRARFPSDTFRNHGILHRGVRLLHEWGLLGRVIATGCPPIRTILLDMDDFPLVGRIQAAGGVDAMYAPRRRYLDHILVEEAVAAGAELREGFSVEDLTRDGDRVTGIRGCSSGGVPVVDNARIVIGADGLHSVVARQVQAPAYHEHPAMSCTYYSYWSDVRVSGLELYRQNEAVLLAFPTNHDLVCVAAQVANCEFDAFRADIDGYFDSVLRRFPGLRDRVRDGRRAEKFLGTGDLPNFLRKTHGPGWALVGDAAYHKDPITANGISDAFRDAASLSEAIAAGLGGLAPLEERLAAHEAARDTQCLPELQGVLEAVSFGPLPERHRHLRAALRNNQAGVDAFVSMFAGSLSPQEFFAPENMQRVMRSAG
jgi:flavin-dependent dehydrogenase